MSKDTKSTLIGMVLAIATAVGDYFTHANADGSLDYTAPTFWLGLVIAALVAVKGYFMHKEEPVAQPTDAPKAPSA
jgi:hypothetical protein